MSVLDTVREIGGHSLALRLGYEAQRRSGLLHRRMRARSGWSNWGVPGILGQEYRAGWEARLTEDRRTLFADQGTAARARKLLGESGINTLVSRAERILRGELPFFGELWLKTGLPPSWFVSALDGAYVDPDRPWTSMGFYDRDYGDLKFILEPSRFLFVGELARAYLLTGDERYPSVFWNAVEDWADHNPPATGPLWICGQESALRIVSWCLGWMAFRKASSTTLDRQAKLLSMTAAHGWRIEQTRMYAKSQRSNHIISEAAGLLTAALVFPELRWSSAWKQSAINELRRAVQDQFSPDGTYAQQSLNYQRMSLQLLAWCAALLRMHESSLPTDITDRMLAARDFLLAVAEPETGRVPNSGANDGTLALPLDTCEYGDFRPTLQLVSKAVGVESALPSGPWDELGLWLFGAGRAVSEQEPHAACAEAYLGFHLLRNSVSRVVLRCEDGHRRPYHADQLHLDIWWKGMNLARDPGTYLYNGEPPWDNGLASTAVHNTVYVDGTDQMERAGRFLWRRWAHGRVLEQGPQTLQAEHDGYCRLGIVHHRAVADLAGRGWIVVDDLIGHGSHTASLNWLLPDVPVQTIQGPPFQAILSTAEGNVSLICLSSAPAMGYLVHSGKRQGALDANDLPSQDELRGWEASTYGCLDPALSVVFQANARMPLRLCSLFLFSPHEDPLVDLDSHVTLRWAECELRVSIPPVGQTSSLSPGQLTVRRQR